MNGKKSPQQDHPQKLVLTESQKSHALLAFRKLEGEVLPQITAEALDYNGENTRLLSSSDAVAPILRTALVINWRESAMKTRYERFRSTFPEINSLAALKAVIDRTDPLDFCRTYLNINANTEAPAENPKYRLLKTLTEAFLDYQAKSGQKTEMDALREWANNIDPDNLGDDPIAKLKGVGIGTVENIRLNLGMSTVKPDRHVIATVRDVLHIDMKPCNYMNLAEELDIPPRHFDNILFRYGQMLRSADQKNSR